MADERPWCRDCGQPIPPEGHEKRCDECGRPCNSFAGNPAEWPVAVGDIRDENAGMTVFWHMGCVMNALRQWRAARLPRAERMDDYT